MTAAPELTAHPELATESSVKPAARTVINILGVTYNTNNYGVRVLLSSAVECLARSRKDVEIRILDYGRESAVWKEPTEGGGKDVKLINLRYSWRLYLPNNLFRLLGVALLLRLIPSVKLRHAILSKNPWVKSILEAEACYSLAGGDSFSDIYGMSRFFYVSLPQLLVLWLDKPLVLLPQTYGPFETGLARWVAGYIMKRATRIYSRDANGVKVVADTVDSERLAVRVMPDLGFSMAPSPVDQSVIDQINQWRKTGPVVGLNISKLLYMGGYTRRNMFSLKEDYVEQTRAIIDYLVREAKAFVLLVPHVYGGPESEESELMLGRKLFPELSKQYPGKIGFLDQVFDHRQIKTVIGQCDVFSGARMHACIAAASQCVPTVALAYSGKFIGVMHGLGEGVDVVDLREATTPQICQAFSAALAARDRRHQALKQVMPGIREKVLSAFAEENVTEANG